MCSIVIIKKNALHSETCKKTWADNGKRNDTATPPITWYRSGSTSAAAPASINGLPLPPPLVAVVLVVVVAAATVAIVTEQ